MSLDALFAQLTSTQITGGVDDTSLIQSDDSNLREPNIQFQGCEDVC